MALQSGEIIEGKYRIVKLIGEGGMGAVYEGENTRIKRRVAIKVLHAQVAEKADVVQRFEREAQAAGRIGSEHIVEVLDLGNLPSGERFMVMEFMDGQDLTARIRAKKRLTPHESVPILHEVLEGLFAAHAAGIFHRDLKPDNIYLLKSKAGRSDFVKILDFGVSKFSAIEDNMAETRAGAVMGTPYYMSPEQAKGGTIDARSDLYAIGVVLYQMTTGRVPFNAGSFNELLFKIALETPEPVDKVVPDLPQSFASIISKAMSRAPADRFQTAREFQEALAQWQMTAPPPAQHYQGTQPMPAIPDMSAVPQLSTQTPASSPGLPAAPASYPTGSGSYPSLPGQVIPGTNTAYPDTGTPAQGTLATSQQVALAVTTSGSKRRSTVVALVLVGAGILGLSGAGVYLAMT
ncbi:MAG: protein kinase, partial [Deltaproteobacteria bacterium]|nr:protein kinase [Deltaproteobacteria bacterium]